MAVAELLPVLAGSGDRQSLPGFAPGDQDATRARISALLRKWLFGGRLSKEEREQLVDVLPSGPARVAREGYAHKPEHYETWYGIERRMFFRWQAHGRAVAEGPDLPPFDQPQNLPAWYEAMRSRGVFKHRMPRKLLERIEQLGAAAAPSPAPPAAGAPAPSAPSRPVPPSFTAPRQADVGLRIEILQQEQRVYNLRIARDEAYANGDRAEGDRLARQYTEEMDSFTVWKQRAMKQAEQEGLMVWKSEVEQDLSQRLTAFVTGGMFFYDRIAVKLEAAATPAAKRDIWRSAWIDHCRKLVESKYAPPFDLEAMTA